ncbi:hypothetical protein RRG08_038611 [Elysia crispata]|uniref:Uncharacterized protein n=1 Tax=Elysia crispata TaxID=231223 RepID=A0AAE1D164_9GAST|nr:hypothetical protein RRG08_038611 [Elysia crispata]
MSSETEKSIHKLAPAHGRVCWRLLASSLNLGVARFDWAARMRVGPRQANCRFSTGPAPKGPGSNGRLGHVAGFRPVCTGRSFFSPEVSVRLYAPCYLPRPYLPLSCGVPIYDAVKRQFRCQQG